MYLRLFLLCILVPVDRSWSQEPAPLLIDKTRSLISTRLVRLANNLDSFFGDQRADDELNRSSLRVSYDYRVRMEKTPVDDTQVRFNLRLPNLEKLFRFSVQKNEPKELDREKPRDADEAARIVVPTSPEPEPWRFRSDVGLNVSYPPVLFARSRLRKNWLFPWVIQRLSEEVGYFTDRGWIQNTTLFHDQALSKTLLLRFVNQQDWAITDKVLQTTHGPSLLKTISDDDAVSLNLRMNSVVEDTWHVNNYGVSVSYRRNLRDQWLFGEIIPAVDFPKAEAFRRAPSILLRLETLFAQN